jgi:hypothetical protein
MSKTTIDSEIRKDVIRWMLMKGYDPKRAMSRAMDELLRMALDAEKAKGVF